MMDFDYFYIGKEAMAVEMDELEEMIVGCTKVISILEDAKKYRNNLGEYTSKQLTAKRNGSKNKRKNTTQDINVESDISVDVPTQNPTEKD